LKMSVQVVLSSGVQGHAGAEGKQQEAVSDHDERK
jgi:hypothetical protein